MAYKVVDVSSWQGAINWAAVAADGVVGAIVRFADGMYVPRDEQFDTNMAGAKAAGLHVGAYIFSRAANAAQAREEADRMIDACNAYGVDLPLYIDTEDPDYAGVANEVVSAFLGRCDERGAKGGIYANLNWFRNYIDTNAFANRPLWIAQYNDQITHENPGLFGMWQYTDSGHVNGIGNCDCNELYVEYWNGGAVAPSNPQPVPTPQPSSYVWTVWNIQCWATICNYGAPDMDDIDGPETARCVGNGQRAYGIPDDEKFGEVTQARAEGQVRGVQQRLKDLGFYNGDIDGIPGPQTLHAVKDFQASVGLLADGIIGEQTFPALFGASPSPAPTPVWANTPITNFTADEFKCECGCGGDVKEELKHRVQMLRNRLSEKLGRDAQIVITSGFRCPDQNARDGGVSDSLHLSGDAVDLYSPGMSDSMVDLIAQTAQECGLGTIRYYGSQFVHVQLYPRDTVGD